MKLRKNSVCKILLLCFALFCSGCATVYNPATGREESVWIDTPQEVSIGRSMVASVEKRFRPYSNLLVQARVNAIGQQVARFSDRKDIRYHFKVIDEDEVNAFAVPGGYVYVFRGLVEKAESDAEIASVLAHEIGHIAARHPVKKMETQMGYGVLMSLAFAKSKNKDFARYIDLGFNLISLGYSREAELLADRLSIRYVTRAGYDPYAVVTFLEKLQKLNEKQEVPYLVIFRSHPLLSQRIGAAKQEIVHIQTRGPVEQGRQKAH